MRVVLIYGYIISHNSKLYQLEPGIRAKKIIVEERIDNSVHIKYNGIPLKYKEIIKRPVKITEKVIKIRKEYIPPADHPWRQTFKKYFKHKTLQMADEK